MQQQKPTSTSKLRKIMLLFLLPVTIPIWIIGWILSQTNQPKQMGKIKQTHKYSTIKITTIQKPITIKNQNKPEEKQTIVAQ